MNKKISISLVDLQEQFDDVYAIEHAKETGADGVDFTLFYHSVANKDDVYAKGQAAVEEYFLKLKNLADSYGIEISQVHGRANGYGLTEESSALFVRNTELDCIAARVLGAKYCVIHTPPITYVGDIPAEQFDAIHDRMMDEILPYAAREGVKIALETHGYSLKLEKMEYFGYIDNLINAVSRAKQRNKEYSDYVCVCVDTGHTNLITRHGHGSVGDAIRKLGSLVEALHMHDNNGIRDQHKMLRTGIIDWDDVFSALEEVGYKGWYNLENVLTHFGKGLEIDVAAFSVKTLRHALAERACK